MPDSPVARRPNPVEAFVRLSRPLFLGGGLAGVGLGTALAAYVSPGTPIDWRAWAIVQFTVSAFQLMTHYSNEYFDRASDAGSTRTAFSGGSGILVDGALAPHVALVSALLATLAGLFGIAVLGATGHPAAAALAFSICVLAWAYSAPPRLLARGLGELDTALIVAVLVPLCAYFAQDRPLTPLALAATLPGAAAMFAMMLAVELPDVESDATGGKRNLLVRAGRTAIVRIGQAALVGVYSGVLIAFGTGAPLSVVLLEATTIPAALALASAFARAAAADPAFPASAGLRLEAIVAARGVAFFLIVSVAGVLGYFVPLTSSR